MPKDIEHPVAYYRDKDGILRNIEAEHLQNSQVMEVAHLNALTDEYEQMRLYPRIPEGVRPHFYTKVKKSIRVFIGEKDPTHDARVSKLVNSLCGIEVPWTLNYCESKDHLVPSLKLPPFSWGAEVTRHVHPEVVVRHDVFGADLSLASSYLRPQIAIEVIHKHYPEEVAFEGMLSLSRTIPYIVFFDHTRRRDKFIRIDSKKNQLIYDANTYSIRNGEVLMGHGRTGITTSAGLKIAFEKLLDRWDSYNFEKSRTIE